MSKKNFTGGLNSLLGETEAETITKKDSSNGEAIKSTKEGTKPNETRATFIVDEDTLDKIKAISYWERLLIKEVITDAFKDAITKYESIHGELKAIPKKA